LGLTFAGLKVKGDELTIATDLMRKSYSSYV